jgi:pimeloyl-ACP methyl ester carboxylesterase
MTTFALVHGGWHGAWCWESLIPFLRQAGHDTVAMDLPSDGLATHETYAHAVCAAIGDRDDDVVLVGHSASGSIVPLVAAQRPLRHVAYLCALMPSIGKSVLDQFDSEEGMTDCAFMAGLGEPDAHGARAWVDRTLARELLYGDCDEETAERAIDRLRPQAFYPAAMPFPLSAFPRVSCTSVVCTEDRMVGPGWSRRVSRERFGAEVVELPGGHSPFLSRPADLADVLLRIATPT